MQLFIHSTVSKKKGKLTQLHIDLVAAGLKASDIMMLAESIKLLAEVCYKTTQGNYHLCISNYIHTF